MPKAIIKQSPMPSSNIKDEPKRLEPDIATKRKLFLLSGNRCAFPGCSRVIMDMDGNFVGEICHIEAAEAGGERFNKEQTNEERRNFSNLMLMCHDHHVVTNNQKLYRVSRLKKMKAAHELKINEFLETMTVQITDRTKGNAATYPKTLHRFAPGTLEEDENNTLASIRTQIDRLAKVPLAARQLFAVALSRSYLERHRLQVSLDDLQEACGLGFAKMHKHWKILELHRIVYDISDYPGHNTGAIAGMSKDWYFWDDLKSYPESGAITLDEIVVDLNFALLD